MVPRSEQLKAELIERLAQRAREAAPAELRDVAERSVRQLYAHVPAEDLLADRPEDLWGAAIALWRFAQERPPGTAKVRVYHPRLEEHGWESPHTIVEIANDDMPFLVDSVTAELARSEVEVHLVVHPVMRVERDAAGRLLAVHDPEAPPEGASAESLMHVRVTAQPAERQEEIRAALEGVLVEVRAAVADWRTMRDRCRALIGELERKPPPLPAEEVEEGHAFLAWLDDHHFTYLGYREYAFEGEGEAAIARVLPESGCGVLRDEQTTVFHGLRSLGSLPPEVRQFLRQPELLSITKANRLSKVHRAVHMDAIAVKCFDPAGRVTGMRLIVGLFTAAAYSSSTRSIPFLRQKVEKVLTRADFAPGSHDAKSLRHILEIYPRDELFQIGDDDLFRIAMGVPAPAAAAADRPLRPPRPLRALRLGAGAGAARPLRQRAAPQVPGDPGGGLPGAGRRRRDLPDRGRLRPPALHHRRDVGGDPGGGHRRRRGAADRDRPLLDRPPGARAGRGARRGGGRGAGPALGQGLPAELPGALRGAGGARGHRLPRARRSPTASP